MNIQETGFTFVHEGEEFSMVVEIETGNKFALLSSYLEQEVDDVVSPYNNGTLEWEDES